MIKRYLLSINTIYLIWEQLLLYIILLNSLIKLKINVDNKYIENNYRRKNKQWSLNIIVFNNIWQIKKTKFIKRLIYEYLLSVMHSCRFPRIYIWKSPKSCYLILASNILLFYFIPIAWGEKMLKNVTCSIICLQ